MQRTLSYFFGQPLWVQTLVGLAILLVVVSVLHLVARRAVLRALQALARRSSMSWDDAMFDNRVPNRATLVIPLLALQVGLELVPGLSPGLQAILERVVGAALVLVAAATAGAFLSALHDLYERTRMAATRPIKSYVQLAKVILYLVAGIFTVAALAGRSPWFFVSGIGAVMAVILLIFRDTLLSLVASVQLSNYDLVRVGDWIEMPQFGADGDVIDLSLHAVRVQNWDKTISVIPTHKFLDHGFKNWRGMFEMGGRRIKRAIHINTSTIRFLTEEEIARFGRFVLLREYITTKTAELREHNAPWANDPDAVVNARRLTNIGTLRAYIIAYLRSHPQIRQDLTFLVRQLAPTAEGLPLEIYVFAADTRWVHYEGIQADIFDHILAMVPEFGLRVYQRPAGGDFEAAAEEGVRVPPAARRGGRGDVSGRAGASVA